MIWLLVFFLANFLLGFNPDSKEYKFIRIFSVFIIFFILYFNINSESALLFIIPLSKSKISLLYDFPSEIKFNDFSEKTIKLEEINSFIQNELSGIDNYAGYVTISYSGYGTYISISEFILFNKYSNSNIIENYIESILIYQESLF
jgi:hypothetical protein